MLDEELIKKEKERTRKLADTRQTEEIRRELQMRQNNQKPVESFFEELEQGFAVPGNKKYKAEKRMFFGESVGCIVFPEDIDLYSNQEKLFVVNYKDLGFTFTIYDMAAKIDPVTGEEYQRRVTEQARLSEMPYQPVESGKIDSGSRQLIYTSGITNSREGYLFSMSFCGLHEKGITGSFICRLRRRFPYENLFKAILMHLYV